MVSFAVSATELKLYLHIRHMCIRYYIADDCKARASLDNFAHEFAFEFAYMTNKIHVVVDYIRILHVGISIP